MKSFRKLVSEVAQPKAGDEARFKAKHVVDPKTHPVAPDNVFTGGTVRSPKRRADRETGEDAAVYEGSFDVPSAAGGEHDSEDSHTKYKKGNKSSKTMKEAKKMDPVGKEDDDIDNDGDVDSSDKYLHARRRAISKAIKKEATDTQMGTITVTSDEERKKRAQMYRDKKAASVKKEEVEQVDELKKSTIGSYINKAAVSKDKASGRTLTDTRAGKYRDAKTFAKRSKGLHTAFDKILGKARINAKEETELDEAVNVKGIQKAVDDGKSMDVIMTMFANKRTTNTDEIRKVAKDYMWKKRMKKEEVEQVDEVKDGLSAAVNRAEASRQRALKKAAAMVKKGFSHEVAARNHDVKVNDLKRHMNEEVELEEAKSWFMQSDHDDFAKMTPEQKKDRHQRLLKLTKHSDSHIRSFAKAAANEFKSKYMNEEVEQVDEVLKSTTPMGTWIKDFQKSKAPQFKGKSQEKRRQMAIAAKYGAEREAGMREEVELDEDAWEEVPMMMSQLEFICYAAEEIMDYLDMGIDPEEWYQNKLANVYHSMMSLYSYARGEMRMSSRSGNGYDDMYGEEVEQIDELSQDTLRSYHAKAGLDLRKKREKLDKGTLTSKDYKQGQNRVTGLNRSAARMEEVESDEPITKSRLNTDLSEVTHSAVKKTVTYIDAKGHSRARNVPIKRTDRDEYGQDKISESTELVEVFNQGIVKLKDGGSVILKKEDADLLNQMFKDLSSTNRKKMQEIAMKDKAGFNEILSFAREAL